MIFVGVFILFSFFHPFYFHQKPHELVIFLMHWLFQRTMCILFMYMGSKDVESDYSLIIISNRDEYYDRPSKVMAPWTEDHNIVGGVVTFSSFKTNIC